MKITYTIETCRDKISPNCTGTFQRVRKVGRPQVNCDVCKAVKATAKAVVTNEAVATRQGNCGCGATFTINPGRGRKPSKCDACRANGTVYRMDDDGELQAIRAEALAEEQRELREQAGRDRAQALCAMMAPLLKKRGVAA